MENKTGDLYFYSAFVNPYGEISDCTDFVHIFYIAPPDDPRVSFSMRILPLGHQVKKLSFITRMMRIGMGMIPIKKLNLRSITLAKILITTLTTVTTLFLIRWKFGVMMPHARGQRQKAHRTFCLIFFIQRMLLVQISIRPSDKLEIYKPIFL